MKMITKIKCSVGLHDWSVKTRPLLAPERKCTKCNKEQLGTYDTMYGTREWH